MITIGGVGLAGRVTRSRERSRKLRGSLVPCPREMPCAALRAASMARSSVRR